MKNLFILISLSMLFGCNQTTKTKLVYPETRKSQTTTDYYGTSVPEPYDWLEDDNSPETKNWVVEQNKVTRGYLDNIPFRQQIKDRYTKLWDYPKVSAPFKAGGIWFTSKNNGLQNQSVIYKLASPEDEGVVFLDPNTFSTDGTVSLTNFTISEDGKYCGYGISRGGSDWNEFFVMDVATGKLLDDHIVWAKFSGLSWFKDGFYYTKYPEPKEGDMLKGVNEFSKLYYHKVGTSQSDDILVYEDKAHPQWGFSAGVTEDEKYLIISVTESTSGNAFYVKSLASQNTPVIKIVEDFSSDFNVIDHENDTLWVMTNYQAPKYKLMKISIKDYAPDKWIDIIPEAEEVLSSVSAINNVLITNYMKDARDQVKIFDRNGKFTSELELPFIGSAGGFGGKREDTFTFFTLTSFISPSTTYKYDVVSGKYELFRKSAIDFNTDDFVTEQIFYPSKDSTLIPLFIIHKKGIELDGNNPCLLYGYGGFNISLTPSFSMRPIIWLENGGIYAVANLRGGGEYGESWHQAGTKMNKQNVFDDFAYAAKYLINNKYTNPKLMAIMGGSNGGLLVGATANQYPELFKVAIPAVGVMDMLKYHLFTIGRYWATDYGTSADSKEMFDYLYAYSPLHNIKENVEYPAIMVTTADHDDRVVPAHSFKYIATMQEKYKGDNPVIIRIEVDAGHGAGTPTAKTIEEYTDLFAFIYQNMGINPFEK